MRFTHLRLLGLYQMVSLLVLGGCLGKGTQDPTKYYLLQPIASSVSGEQQTGAKDNGISVGVGPVRMREYLNRPQVVTRTGENEIQIGQFHNWAEPLGDNFSTILATNLSTLLETNQIALWPWGRKIKYLEYQVMADVMRFDGALGGDAVLFVRWYIVSHKEGMKTKEITAKKSTFTAPMEGENYEALVTVMSKILGDFSREVAETIKARGQ